jgi:hypothetical protein
VQKDLLASQELFFARVGPISMRALKQSAASS